MAAIGTTMLLFIPQVDEEREIMERIDKAASYVATKRYRLEPMPSFMITTIATVYYESIVKLLSLKVSAEDASSAYINFQDLAEFKSSYRTNSEAEKEGNINCVIKAGTQIFNQRFTNLDIPCSEAGFIVPSGEAAYFNDLRLIDQFTKKECYDKNSITLTEEWLAHTLALVVFETMVQTLFDDMIASGGETQSITFNDVFAMHILPNPESDYNTNDILSLRENAMVVLKPLKNAKLLIKSDEGNMFKED